MQYIILDLEWNNAYSRRLKGFLNEIIEIGAVKLDDKLKKIDEFSCFIKTQVNKKLRGSIKKLTNISNDDLKTGTVFTKAMSDFRDWVGNGENVVLTWGNSDIRTLIDNFRYLNGIETIPFLTNYVDVQEYVQNVLGASSAHQLGLSAAAEQLEISEDDYSHHRALDDSKLTADCFIKTFDREKFMPLIIKCDNAFYGKMAFKPYPISSLNNPQIDKSYLSYTCEKCGSDGKVIKNWRYSNQFFRAVYRCPVCKTCANVAVRYKKFYDHIEIKKNVIPIPPGNASKKKKEQ